MKKGNIRLGTMADVISVKNLIDQLEFIHPIDFIAVKLEKLLHSTNDLVFVYEHKGEVVAMITLHFSIQLAFEGDFMTIGYMVVDERYRGLEIGKQLEEYASDVAKERKCSLIEVFSQAKRTEAHRFYIRQGYSVAEKFFSKEV